MPQQLPARNQAGGSRRCTPDAPVCAGLCLPQTCTSMMTPRACRTIGRLCSTSWQVCWLKNTAAELLVVDSIRQPTRTSWAVPAVTISACCELPYKAPVAPTPACGLHVCLYLTAAKNGLLSWFINGKWCEAMHFLAVVLCLAFSVAWDQVSDVTAGSGMFHERTGQQLGSLLAFWSADPTGPPLTRSCLPPLQTANPVLCWHSIHSLGLV